MPRGAYQAIIEGPAARLKEIGRPLVIEPALTQALLADIEDGGGRDALPLLAFTLERLYLEYGARGRLTLNDYDVLGRIKGSIEAAIERAFRAADNDARIPRDREARLALLRRGLIPWLAGIDPDTGSPRRQKARISEIPEESRPLIDLLVGQRLLSTDATVDAGEATIEPTHEALLRQWGLLQGWLQSDFAALSEPRSRSSAPRAIGRPTPGAAIGLVMAPADWKMPNNFCCGRISRGGSTRSTETICGRAGSRLTQNFETRRRRSNASWHFKPRLASARAPLALLLSSWPY